MFSITAKGCGEHELFHQMESETPSSTGGRLFTYIRWSLNLHLMKPAAHRRVAHRKMSSTSHNSRGIVKTIPIEISRHFAALLITDSSSCR